MSQYKKSRKPIPSIRCPFRTGNKTKYDSLPSISKWQRVIKRCEERLEKLFLLHWEVRRLPEIAWENDVKLWDDVKFTLGVNNKDILNYSIIKREFSDPLTSLLCRTSSTTLTQIRSLCIDERQCFKASLDRMSVTACLCSEKRWFFTCLCRLFQTKCGHGMVSLPHTTNGRICRQSRINQRHPNIRYQQWLLINWAQRIRHGQDDVCLAQQSPLMFIYASWNLKCPSNDSKSDEHIFGFS